MLPAYNEAVRITASLEQIFDQIKAKGWDAEVLVVDDGSTDGTANVVQDMTVCNPGLKLIKNPGNHGKGYSVRNGMLRARGDVLLFSDADLSSPIAQAEKLFAAIADGADIAIGSRWMRTELQLQRQPIHRQIFGRIFNLALRIILGLNFKDTQCGFKAFSHKAAHIVFPLQHVERWGFDPELLFLAKRNGLTVKEVPVEWSHRDGTRIRPIRDGMRMFFEMLKIRWNSLRGKYSQVPAAVGSL